ncbi:MAG: hypothetical protein GX963_08805 [Bacteroidales bacterium]|nr:hypothetical protein [Bacteroidales bacterium]
MNEDLNLEVVYELFDELKEELASIAKKEKSAEQPEIIIDLNLIKETMKSLEASLEKMRTEDSSKTILLSIREMERSVTLLKQQITGVEIPNLQQHIVKLEQEVAQREKNIKKAIFAFDTESPYFVISYLLFIILLGISLNFNGKQFQSNLRLRDTKIKYDYIFMHGGADEGTLLWIEDVFGENGDKETKRKIKKAVREFEEFVRDMDYKNARLKLKEKEKTVEK